MRLCNNIGIKSLKRSLAVLMVVIAAVAIGIAPSFAQKDGGNHSKRHAEMMRELQEFKIKYLIQEAQITKEQQPEFVRIYTELNNAKMSLFKTYHDNQKSLKAKASPTDEDYNKVSEEMAGSKSAEGALDMKCYQQLKKLLTPHQLYKLKEAEMKFNRKMMKMRDQKK